MTPTVTISTKDLATLLTALLWFIRGQRLTNKQRQAWLAEYHRIVRETSSQLPNAKEAAHENRDALVR